MGAFIIRRIAFMVLLLVLITLVVFLLFAALPADPAALTCGKSCSPSVIAANRIRLGYDKPLLEQYFLFMRGIFVGRTYGTGAASFTCPAPSFGYSFNQGECVTDLLTKAFPVTLYLSIGAFILWMIGGIGLGIIAALNRGKLLDHGSTVISVLGISMPTFFVGLLTLYIFTIWLKWLPAPNYVSPTVNPVQFLQTMILPWATIAFLSIAIYTRLTRDGMLEVMGEEYVKVATATGMPRKKVVNRYILRGALTPIVTIAGLDLALLLGGAIITESVFNLPGMGKLAIRSVAESDLPVLAAVTLVTGAIVVIANAVVDILYASLDPRVRIDG